MPLIAYAIFAGVAFGAWTIFHKLAAPHISQVLGAILVSLFAVVAGGLIMLAAQG